MEEERATLSDIIIHHCNQLNPFTPLIAFRTIIQGLNLEGVTHFQFIKNRTKRDVIVNNNE
jgi:hypothetical protein